MSASDSVVGSGRLRQTQIIRSYEDAAALRDNVIHLNKTQDSEFIDSSVEFAGTGNVLYVEDGAKLRSSRLRFLGNNAVIHIRTSPSICGYLPLFSMSRCSTWAPEHRLLPKRGSCQRNANTSSLAAMPCFLRG